MPHFCHISATQFYRCPIARKKLIFYFRNDPDSFQWNESEEPEISVSSQFFPVYFCKETLVGEVFPVVLSFPR